MAELSANATKIMDLVKELTIVELNDLVKAMEEEFGVSAAAPVMVAAAGGAVEAEEKTAFDAVLTSAG
jgi:large subunit ribosomal protein L7/L12